MRTCFAMRHTSCVLAKASTRRQRCVCMQLVEVVCCKMTELQRSVYNHFVESKAAARMLNQGKGGTKVLGAITALKKLCNHPKLVYDALHSKGSGMDGFESCGQFFPPGATLWLSFKSQSAVGLYSCTMSSVNAWPQLQPHMHGLTQTRAWRLVYVSHSCNATHRASGIAGMFDDGRPGRGGLPEGWEALSGKFTVLAQMLSILWNKTHDKIVIVSNYTQTLDLVATLCRANAYPFVRLDGTTTINKRQKMVRMSRLLWQHCNDTSLVATCACLKMTLRTQSRWQAHKSDTSLHQ